MEHGFHRVFVALISLDQVTFVICYVLLPTNGWSLLALSDVSSKREGRAVRLERAKSLELRSGESVNDPHTPWMVHFSLHRGTFGSVRCSLIDTIWVSAAHKGERP